MVSFILKYLVLNYLIHTYLNRRERSHKGKHRE